MNGHLALLPVMIPFAGAIGVLYLRRRARWQGWWALGSMAAALLASLVLLVTVWRTQAPVVFQVGGWPAPIGITLVGDLLSAIMVVMAQLVLCAGILYAIGSKDHCVHYPTFYTLFLTLATGLTGAFMTGDLFNLFVFSELLVFSGAALTAISDDKYGAEAAFKYFFISILSSLFLLVAVGSLYVAYGTLNMADLAARIAIAPDRPLVPVAMVGLLIFFMVKSAVVPFHFWQPDFHTASPTAVSAMLSSIVVKLGVYGFLRMTTLWFLPQAEMLRTVLIVLGVVGVVFGGFTAVGAQHAKRMLAYSTLGQIGFILVAIGWGSPLALAAAIIFTFNHSLIKSAMLMLAGAVASRAAVKTAAFEVVGGLGRAMPQAGLLFFLGGMALAGIPPTNGFINKLMVFRSGVEAGQFIPLAIIAAASIFSIIYVGRAFQKIWWQPPAEGMKAKASGDRLLAPALLVGLCVALGLWGEPLIQLAQAAAAWMQQPAAYVSAVLGG